jgi:hypothetical protein
MTERVGAKKGYPIMALKSWRRKICACCNAGNAGCLSFRRTETCPIDKALRQLHRSMRLSP